MRWYLERAAQERDLPVDLALPVTENPKRLELATERDCRLVLTIAALQYSDNFTWEMAGDEFGDVQWR